MSTSEWEYFETVPLSNGKYACRMNEWDEEPEIYNVENGKAFNPLTGSQRIVFGCEWKVLE